MPRPKKLSAAATTAAPAAAATDDGAAATATANVGADGQSNRKRWCNTGIYWENIYYLKYWYFMSIEKDPLKP